jgi:UDP-3-O-acyl-N-acetylglucosamine deacetylase
MSTKTTFKRVALVAVAALGLGVLTSVAPANAATIAPTAVTAGTPAPARVGGTASTSVTLTHPSMAITDTHTVIVGARVTTAPTGSTIRSATNSTAVGVTVDVKANSTTRTYGASNGAYGNAVGTYGSHSITLSTSGTAAFTSTSFDVDLVTDTSRGTTLSLNGASVSTVEHALAAAAGLQIDNLLIEINGPEVPILDGSARFFIESLEQAGIVELEADRIYYELKTNVFYNDPSRNVEIIAVPSDTFKVKVMIDFNSRVLGFQHAQLDSIVEFKDEVASCRTFVFLHELKMLLENNLIKGGDLSNAIVYVDRQLSSEDQSVRASLFNRSDLIVTNEGTLNNVEIKYQNEAARHKLLDVVGDLSLIGRPIKGTIIATRPGHAANVEFARKIKKVMIPCAM